MRIRRSFTALVVVMLSLTITLGQFSPVIALELRPDDVDSIINETTLYDLVPLGSCGAAADSAGVTLEGKDNIQKGFNYFIAKGLTPIQSAGIIGNLRQESGMNPKSKQLNGGPGRGLAQWTVTERWVDLQAFAKNKKQDPLSLNLQLDFIWHEMNNVAPWKETLPMISKTTTIDDVLYTSGNNKGRIKAIGSVKAFERGYERAGNPVLERRIKFAKEVLAAFGGAAPKGTNGDTNEDAPATDACGADSTGVAVDGYSFPVAPQTKRSYTNLPCNNASIEGFGKNPNAEVHNYTSRFGQTNRITTCHLGDNSPAFDLMYKGVAGKPIYAITKGKPVKINRSYLMKTSSWGKPCGSIQFQATDNKAYYWYGHILPSSKLTLNKEIAAGTEMGKVATHEYGPNCWGGGEHLHIDRGCKDKGGKYYTGGNDNCRDAAFLTDLQKIWEGLKK